MRKLGQELGVDAMALYRHVRDKDDLLDGDRRGRSSARSTDPRRAATGRPRCASQVMAARAVMLRHPWARRVLEERGTGGPRCIGYIESVLAIAARRRLLDRARPPRAARAGQPDLRVQPGPVRRLGPRPDAGARPRCSRGAGGQLPARRRARGSVSHEGVLGRCDDDVEFALRPRPDPRRPRAASRGLTLTSANGSDRGATAGLADRRSPPWSARPPASYRCRRRPGRGPRSPSISTSPATSSRRRAPTGASPRRSRRWRT